MTTTPDDNDRRSLVTSLSTSAGRRFWTQVVVVILVLLPIVAYFATHFMFDIMGQIEKIPFQNPEDGARLVQQLRAAGFLFLSVIIMLCMLSIYFVFFLAVRVFGPQVALVRFIEQLKSGDYSEYRNLRREDQLREIWQALQELAATLRERYGSKRGV